ncbi:SDR family NAD(P)-dependent oxidoreductase [Nitriliruptor alkaliphilus]|uniref:SDR family NAD(P)-dependent oxidoreductase n=1 Tax=Nitriliruptor alkaliphilus TaxID=427918 RepID=UPI000698280D|nr:SDR family oxidoreductase [Nitriliruptor alkaliphilus]
MSDLEGRVAVVTGGSRGIGAAVVRRLAADGADVVLTYRDAADRATAVVDEVERLGRRGLAVQADVRDPAAVEAAMEAAAARFGCIDLLVNNAGVFPVATIEELTLEDYQEATEIHVRGVFAGVRAALVHMPDGGRIVTIGSSLAERVPDAGLSLYSLTKAALVGFTKGLARDLGPRGICATVVHPGSIDTEMNPADGPHADGERALTALGRYGRPDEIAAMVAHLCGPGGGYVTGVALTVDGGATA